MNALVKFYVDSTYTIPQKGIINNLFFYDIVKMSPSIHGFIRFDGTSWNVQCRCFVYFIGKG